MEPRLQVGSGRLGLLGYLGPLPWLFRTPSKWSSKSSAVECLPSCAETLCQRACEHDLLSVTVKAAKVGGQARATSGAAPQQHIRMHLAPHVGVRQQAILARKVVGQEKRSETETW